MKILWICNIMLPMVAEFLQREASNKEGWLTGLADMILKNRVDNHVELAIAFPVVEALPEKWFSIPVKGAAESSSGNLLQCYSFVEDVTHPEVYPEDLEEQLQQIVADFKPDVVHCFGTEYPHTLALTRVYPGEKVLIGIQGLCKLYAQRYLADLPQYVINRVTFRDFLKKDSIRQQHDKFTKRGIHEVEALCNAGNVTGRTWIDKQFAMETNSKLKYHFMNETLRSNFYEGRWLPDQCEKHSIFLSQGDYPIKGLHYMLKAMPEILEKYPDTKVYVAGNSIVNYRTLKDKIKISSYGKYILELLKKYDLEQKVIFTGRMNAEEMKACFLRCSLFVCPSVIENSPNSLGEAMLLGMPCVTAQVGGIASVFTDGVDGIAYPGYGAACYEKEADKEGAQAAVLAEAVIRMWSDEEKMMEYAQNASAHARKHHDGQVHYQRLIEIYEALCSI